MVPPSSHGISRAPRYFGYCSSTFVFTYRILTFSDQPSHAVRLTIVVLNAVLNPERIAPLGLASSAFARHYSQNLGWFLFLALLRCFSSGGSPHIPIYSVYDTWTWLHVDCSIRTSTDQCLLTTPRSFSQLTTSFIGSQCQGILHMLFFAWTTKVLQYFLYILWYTSVLIAWIAVFHTCSEYLSIFWQNCFLLP